MNDSTWRYTLSRRVTSVLEAGEKTFTFIGVNPSTATDDVDDATVRKLIGFTRTQGFDAFYLVNIFARRSTDVHELTRLFWQGEDIVGADNMDCIRHHAKLAHIVVPCWGSRLKLHVDLRHRLDFVTQELEKMKVPMGHFGRTKSGDPKHPLMLPYNTKLHGWYDET